MNTTICNFCVGFLCSSMFVSGCATRETRADHAMNQLHAAVTAFQASQHRYPKSVAELAASVAGTKTLDLAPLGKVVFTNYKDGAFTISAEASPDGPIRVVACAAPSHM